MIYLFKDISSEVNQGTIWLQQDNLEVYEMNKDTNTSIKLYRNRVQQLIHVALRIA